MSRLWKPLILFILFVLAPVAAWAAEAAGTAVDFTPLVNWALAILAAVLTGVGGWGVRRLFQWMGIKRDSAIAQAIQMDQDKIEKIIALGVGYAKAKAQDYAAGRAKVDIKNDLIRLGAGYVINSVPDLLTRQNITPSRVADMVVARLPKLAPEVVPDDATATPAD